MGNEASGPLGEGDNTLETLCKAMEQMEAANGGSSSTDQSDVHKKLLEAKDLVSKNMGDSKGFQDILGELEKTSAADVKAKAKKPTAEASGKSKISMGVDIKPEKFDFELKTAEDGKKWESFFTELAASKGYNVQDFNGDTVVLKDANGKSALECPDEEPDWDTLTYPLKGTVCCKVYDAEDVSWGGDGKLVKQRLRIGQNEDELFACSKVKIRAEAATDGTSDVDGFNPRTFTFVAGSGSVCDLLEIAAVKLKTGERAMFSCSDLSLCADTEDEKFGLAAVSTGKVVVTLELLEVEAISETKDMSEAERIQFGTSQKELGSILFARGRLYLALARYRKVLDMFPDAGSSDKTEIKDLRKLCESNCAACFLKLCNYVEARQSCSRVLCEEPSHSKALCRRAQCNIKLNNFADAILDVKKVIDLDPQNQTARNLLKEARAGQKGCDKDAKELFGKMLK